MEATQNLTLYSYMDEAYQTQHGKEIKLLLNPNSLKYDRNISYSDDKQLGAIGGGTRFERYEPENLSFDFNIDCTGIVEGTLEGDTAYHKVKELEDALYIYNKEMHRPSYVVIAYGELIFKGQLSKMNVDYQLFNRDGVPMRANVVCSFIGFRASDEERKMFTKLSPDMSRQIVLKENETLALICHQIYGDSQLVYEVAKFNNLVGFRGIPAGTKLLLPPLKK